MIELGLVNLITGDSDVVAIAPEGGFPITLPENQPLPSWTYLFAGGMVEHTLQGERGPRHRRVQIDCYGYSAADAFALAEAIDKVLDDYSGPLTDGLSILGMVISCLMEGEPVDYFDATARTWRRMIEYDLFYR